MLELCYRPRSRRVARGTVLAKQFLMSVFGAMTRAALERRFSRRDSGMSGVSRFLGFMLTYPCEQATVCGILDAPPNGFQADVREGSMIHRDRTHAWTLVFDVTAAACPDCGVKGSRLTLQKRRIVRMTCDALARFRALNRRMACTTVSLQRSV